MTFSISITEDPAGWLAFLPWLLPLITVGLPLLFVGRNYKIHKNVDLQHQMEREKRQAYRDCLAGFADLAVDNAKNNASDGFNPNSEILAAATKGHAIASLYGDEDVTKHAGICMTALISRESEGKGIPELLDAMKKDLEATKGKAK